MNKAINVGLAAFGMSGKVFHGPLLKVDPRYKVTSIVQRTRRRGAEEYFPLAKIVVSFDELVTEKDIDLVIVNTPDKTHYEFTKKALLAGKHVVVEKPFTINIKEGLELIEIAKQQQKILTVFHNRRWDGGFLTVKRILEEGHLGRIAEFEAHYDRFRNFIQEDTWKEEAETGGTGTLYNLGSHLIDEALQLFGLPSAVWADIRTMRRGGMVTDYFNLLLRYKSTAVILRSSYLVKEPGPRYIIHGTKGSFIKYGIDPQEERLKAGHLPDEADWGNEQDIYWGTLNTGENVNKPRSKYKTINGNYPAFYDNLYHAIREGKALAVKPEEALNIIHVIESAIQSNKERKEIPLTAFV